MNRSVWDQQNAVLIHNHEQLLLGREAEQFSHPFGEHDLEF
jgi:hypothetical protein